MGDHGGRVECVRHAATDYRWLLDRGYPDEPAIKLVGDRYRLTRVERGMLYRGVFSRDASEKRAGRLCRPEDIAGQRLTADGHNVLFTLWNYLAGRPLVAATDRFVRDIGGTRSRLPRDERFNRLGGILVSALLQLPAGDILVYLDEQLPWSRDHGVILQSLWDESPAAAEGRAFLVRPETSVDARIAAVSDGCIATSDSGIIDRCAAPVLDLAGYILREEFDAVPPLII